MKKPEEKTMVSVYNGAAAKCKQLLDSFAKLCGGKKNMKIVLSVAGAVLCAVIVLSIVLCGGNAKKSALKCIPNYAESAYMLEYNSKYDFRDEPSGDILPNNGIIVLYETYNNFYVSVCKSNGRVIETLNNNMTRDRMLDAKYPGEELLYKADLEFITECMEDCILVGDGAKVQEINEWYKFSDNEIAE
ncbi:MAG: hypothetical protein E7559_07605 [Ruminococcaceae bacterium]|nr:hypothetical protein [Oscillospiraceae bacterium]